MAMATTVRHYFRRSLLQQQQLRRHTSHIIHQPLHSSTMESLSGPEGYAKARIEANAKNNEGRQCNGNNPASPSSSSLFVRTVEDRPYLPLLKVDPSNEASVLEVARLVVSCRKINTAAMGNNDTHILDEKKTTDSNDITIAGDGKVTTITGGLTNALFKVDLPTTTNNNCNSTTAQSSVLVRVFGAEGMIDRDEETTHFARLCNATISAEEVVAASSEAAGAGTDDGVLHEKLDLVGRFGNGRVETFIPNMRQAHHITDFEKEGLALEVARQLARLHYGYTTNDADSGEEEQHQSQPTLWKVIESWITELSQDISHEKFQEDSSLLELFSLATNSNNNGYDGKDMATTIKGIKEALTNELIWLKDRVETNFPSAPIVFCHNDVNAANILLDASIGNADSEHKSEREGDANNNSSYNKHTVCIIDYEYGSINYAMYDIANFCCEHCGGNDNGIPDFGLLPDEKRMGKFLREYVRERDNIIREGTQEYDTEEMASEVSNLLAQVQLFQMASNLYWGIWGVLQAAGEVIDGTFKKENARSRLEGTSDLDEWDNLRYGRSRLERFHICKRELLGEK